MALSQLVKDNDWVSVRQAIAKIGSTSLGPTSTPTFAGLTLTGLTASRLLSSDASKVLTSTDLSSWVSGTANEINITDDGNGTIIIGIVDPLIVAKGGSGAATFTDHSILLGSGTSAFTALGAATNGQLPIGSTGADPVLAGLTGTANQITVTNGAGSITLSTPQDIGTGSSPTFTGLTLSGITDTHVVFSNSGVLSGSASLVWDGSDLTTSGLVVTSAIDASANSVIFQPAADSTTFFQILDADGGTPIFNVDSTNERVGIGTATPNNKLQVSGLINFDDTNNNTLLGTNAFNNDNGKYNVGIGYQAGYYNDTTGAGNEGDYNTYIGYQAGYGASGSNNTGYMNVAFGWRALYNNQTGYRNFALGTASLTSLLTGRDNIGIGPYSLYQTTDGVGNVAIGNEALRSSTSDDYDIAIGYNALYTLDGGASNIAIGRNAGYSATTASNTVMIGTAAGRYLTTGGRSVYIGSSSGLQNQTGQYNVVIGRFAGYGVASNSYEYNTFIGDSSGYSISTGSNNIFIGYKSGYNQTTNSNFLIIDNQDRGSAANEAIQSLIYGVFNATPASQSVTLNSDLNVRHHLAGIPDEITATSEGVAASVDTINTEVTTNGDSDLDNVTLANGTSGQIKHIYCVVEGNAADTWKITPATMVGGTQITFSGVGEGCTLVYADNEGWCVVANNGGTIS